MAAIRTQDPTIRLRQVLHGLSFPAEKWQLIAHAEHYGADARSMGELWELPVGSFPRLDAVLAAVAAGGFPRHRAAAAPTVSARMAPSNR